MNASLSQRLHDQTLDRLIDRFGLTEEHGEGGGPWLSLVSQLPMVQGEVGRVRVFRGGPLSQLLTCTITVPPIGLDSHMLFAFTDTESALPHFTVDSVKTGDVYAFHLDLIPRLDLAVSLAYMDQVFGPLTEAFQQHRELEGLSPAQLDPRQYAVMSPWMCVNRTDEAAFRATFDTVNTYLDHWFGLVDRGIDDDATAGTTVEHLAARDAGHRGVIFNAEVDKVWNQITPMIGADAVARIIGQLRATRG